MNLKWLSWFVAASALSLSSEASPTVKNYAKFHQVGDDWDALRQIMENIPRNKASDLLFFQNCDDSKCPKGTNLLHLYLYNLDRQGCRTELPLDSNKEQTTRSQVIILSDIVKKNPGCFASGDTVVFAATMEASDGNVNPILFPAAIIMDTLGNTEGLIMQIMQFSHDLPMLQAPPGFFTRGTFTTNNRIPFKAICPIPDTSKYQEAPGVVSNFQHLATQAEHIGVQLTIVPSRPGCSSVNIIGDYNPNAPIAFPDDCFGTVIATKINRQINSKLPFPIYQYQCGDTIPYKFKLDPTEGTTVVFSAETHSFESETVDCVGEVSKATQDPPIPAKHVHIMRTWEDDKNRTDIDYVLFDSGSSDCTYKWYDTFEDGKDHVIGVEKLLADPCFVNKPVAMKIYHKHICKAHPNVLPLPKLQFTTSNITNHEVYIELKSNQTRTHYSAVVHDYDRCMPNEKSVNDTVVDVNAVTIARGSLEILDTRVTRIQLYRDERCSPVITLRNGQAGSIETPDLSRFVDLLSGTCLKYGDTVSLRYAYDSICVNSWFWIPGSVRLVENRDASTLKVYFPGNTPETSLGVYTELVANTCVPEYVIPHTFANSDETPAVSVSYLSFQNALSSPDDRQAIGVEFYSLNEKQPCQYFWSKKVEHNTTEHLRVQDLLQKASCFASASQVRTRIVYNGICKSNDSVIPITLDMRKPNGANGLVITLDGNSSTNAFRIVSDVYDRCETVKQPNMPWFDANDISIIRKADDIFDTKISYIRFYKNATCHGLWKMKNGGPRSVEQIYASSVISSSGCLQSSDTVFLQYKYESICPATWFWMQAAVRLSSRNRLAIYAAGTAVEDHLLPDFHLSKPPILRSLRASTGTEKQ